MTRILIPLILCLSILFTSCGGGGGSDGSDSNASVPSPSCGDFSYDSEINLAENSGDELYWNYLWLRGFYLFGSAPYTDFLGSHADYNAVAGTPAEQTGAMYSGLDDRYTRYFDPDAAPDVLDGLLNSTAEAILGFYLIVEPAPIGSGKIVTVYRVIPDSPAADAGVLPGDQIVAIDGTPIVGQDVVTLYYAATEGGVGTSVLIEFERGFARYVRTLVKREVDVPTVWTDVVDGLGVIEITGFKETTVGTAGTAAEFRAALTTLAAYDRIIIDLRGNPGGLLNEALAIADEMVAIGILIQERAIEPTGVSCETREIKTIHTATAGGLGEGKDYIVLVDWDTASAAEILTSALRDNLSSPVVGVDTYGKWIGQLVVSTPLDGLSIVTSFESFNTLGESYHLVGIHPDIFAFPGTELLTAVDRYGDSAVTVAGSVAPRAFAVGGVTRPMLDSLPGDGGEGFGPLKVER